MHKISNSDWADVLSQAFPYIRQFIGKTVVVKYGGNAMLNAELKQAVMQDVVLMNTVGIRTVLVHGGGPEINAALEKVGKESKFVNGLRYTDAETMEIVLQVLTGKLNKEITALVEKCGGRAIGMSGVDGNMMKAVKLTEPDLGFVGEVTSVNPDVINTALDNGFIPVISTVALGEGEEIEYFNINADTAAAKIAVALKAEKFVQMTNVPGLLRDVEDKDSLIHVIKRSELQAMISGGSISSGMIPKVLCCTEALEGGVSRAHIIDGRIPHALMIEIFSDRGVGTMIT